MKEMYKRLFFVIVLLSTVITFSACSDDDDDLTLDNTEVSVIQGETATVSIKSGNGGYEVTPADATIATATVSGNEITVTGVKSGETTLTLTDKEKKSAVIKVKVTSLAAKIAATYKGNLVLAIAPEDPIEKEIELTASGENVKVTLANFSFGEIPLGDIIVDGIELNKSTDAINLVEKEVPYTINLGMPIEVKVKISGTVKEETLDLVITVSEVPLLNTIPITFSGKKVEK